MEEVWGNALSRDKARTTFKEVREMYKAGKLADLGFSFKAIEPRTNAPIRIEDSDSSGNGGSDDVLNPEDVGVSDPEDDPAT
jgi:hypothetical protein